MAQHRGVAIVEAGRVGQDGPGSTWAEASASSSIPATASASTAQTTITNYSRSTAAPCRLTNSATEMPPLRKRSGPSYAALSGFARGWPGRAGGTRPAHPDRARLGGARGEL